MICPKCKQDRAYRTERVSRLDHTLNRFLLKPYSCHACTHRFHALRQDLDLETLRMVAGERFAGLRRRLKRRRTRRRLVMGAVTAIVAIAVVYFVVQGRA